MRLKALLSAQNAAHLDTMLEILTKPESRTYSGFWSEFNERKGGAAVVSSPVASQAWNALRELHDIVKEYRNG
jgi:hypothetical protein